MPATKTFEEMIRELEERYGIEIKEPEPQPGIREMRKVYRPKLRTKIEKTSSNG